MKTLINGWTNRPMTYHTATTILDIFDGRTTENLDWLAENLNGRTGELEDGAALFYQLGF